MTYRLALGGGADELLAKVLPVLVGRGLVDDDLLVVVRQLVDDVLVLLAELQVVVGGDALLRNRGSVMCLLVSQCQDDQLRCGAWGVIMKAASSESSGRGKAGWW